MKIETVKSVAKRLKRALADAGTPVPHGWCLEAIAAGFGFRTYAALQAAGSTLELVDWEYTAVVARLLELERNDAARAVEGDGDVPPLHAGLLCAVAYTILTAPQPESPAA